MIYRKAAVSESLFCYRCRPQVCEFCDIVKKTYFVEHLRMATSGDKDDNKMTN